MSEGKGRKREYNRVVLRLGDNCVESHSLEELEEWGLRWEERHQAEDPGDQTYSDKILHEVLGFSPQER